MILYEDDDYEDYRKISLKIYKDAGITYPDYSEVGFNVVLDGFSIMHGIPIIVVKNDTINFYCIDLLSSMSAKNDTVPCRDYLKLINRVERLQKKAIWSDMNANLPLFTMKLMDEQLKDFYDELLFLYITEGTLADYDSSWKKIYKEELQKEFRRFNATDVYMFTDVITTGIMIKRQGRMPPYKNDAWLSIMVNYAQHSLTKLI